MPIALVPLRPFSAECDVSAVRQAMRQLRDRLEWRAELGEARLVVQLESYLSVSEQLLKQIEDYHSLRGPWEPSPGWSAVLAAHEDLAGAVSDLQAWPTGYSDEKKRTAGAIDHLNQLLSQVGLSLAELGSAVKFRSRDLLALATAAPLTNAYNNSNENNEQRNDLLVRGMHTLTGLLVNELVAAANRPELMNVSTGQDNISLSSYLKAQSDALERVKIEVASPVGRRRMRHVEAVAAAVREIRASAEFFNACTPPLARGANNANQSNSGAHELLIRQTKRVRLAISLLARFCGIPRAEVSAGELVVLLRGVRDDPRWAHKLKPQSVALNLKAYLSKAISAVEQIYHRQREVGPFYDVLRFYVEAERSVLAIAQWTPDERNGAAHPQETLAPHNSEQLSKLLGTARQSIINLGTCVGLDLTAQFALEQASVAKRSQHFGRWAGMSERRANIYRSI